MQPLRSFAPVALLVVCVGLAPAAAPLDATATFDYWTGLHRVLQEKAVGGTVLADVRTPRKLASGLKEASSAMRDVAHRAGGLAVTTVDDEAIRFAAAAVEVALDSAALFDDLAVYLADAGPAVDPARTFDPGAVAVIRGVLGDPVRGTSEPAKQLEARRLKLLARFAALQEKAAQLETLEPTTRAALAKRYSRTFATITWTKPPPPPTYQVVIGSITIAPAKADKSGWDGFGGLPDPFVKVKNVTRNIEATTDSKSNTLKATYDYDGPLVTVGEKLEIEAWDKDVQFNDAIGSTTHEVTAKDLAAGKLALTFGQVTTLELRFVKK